MPQCLEVDSPTSGTLRGPQVDTFDHRRRSTRSLSTAVSKRSMTCKAEQRRAGAEAKLTSRVEDLTALEEDLATEVTELDSAWAARGAEVETISIGLERTDVSVEELAVVWLPVA